ncbi:MAG: DUF2403 domain-containing lipoprotein [Deltaproteobacteria bacterium]|nr:DUF2403 domain-containing lipoprotein [Deltaproteobacteria bacterium]
MSAHHRRIARRFPSFADESATSLSYRGHTALVLRPHHPASARWLCVLLAACGSPAATPGDAPTHDAGPDGTMPAGGLGAADFGPGDLDPPSHGATITFEDIGKAGWYPSRRDPATGPCDAYSTDTCCLAKENVTGDALTPWDADLIMTLRGPLHVKQLAAYQIDPARPATWQLVSGWDERAAATSPGAVFSNIRTPSFTGTVGSECLVDVSTDQAFACGPGSVPYCPPSSEPRYLGWGGAKLFVILATMPHADALGGACSTGTTGNWYDAPWIGLSHGELVRAGAFSSCQCYAKDPAQWWLGDGCGQFNVFEVVNDNNASKNLGVFSTNFFGYAGYVGEGPCGAACDVGALDPTVDLIDKAHDTEAATGAVARPGSGPGAAFRRPLEGYRYFVILMDPATRTVQLAVVHPAAIPPALAPLLPQLPAELDTTAITALTQLRLPH